MYGRPDHYLTFSLDGGRTFLPEICWQQSGIQPYDGAEYDSIMHVPGTNQLLLTYASCKTAIDMEILGTTISVELIN